MNQRLTYGIFVGTCLGACLLGCAPKVQSVENVKRAAPRWPASETATGATHICLEYSTAAHELHDRTATAAVQIAEGQNVELSYSDAESLASIYSVGEIMQFGHSALYRLCEASGNQSIDPKTYEALFSSTIDKVHGLIELELLRDKLKSVEYLSVLRSQLNDLDARRCELSRNISPASARDLRTKNEERKELMAQIKDLATTLGLRDQIPTTTGSVPSASAWDKLKNHEAAIEKHFKTVRAYALANVKDLTDKDADAIKYETENQARVLDQRKAQPPDPAAEQAAKNWKDECTGYKQVLLVQGDACHLDAVVEDFSEVCPW